VAKAKRVNGNGPKDVSKKAPSTSFEKVRKGKMLASLERHDQFFSKHSAQVEKLYKSGKKKSEIARQFEKEMGGEKQAVNFLNSSARMETLSSSLVRP
jgi:hypothetical protein